MHHNDDPSLSQFYTALDKAIDDSSLPKRLDPEKRFLCHDEIEVFPGARAQDIKVRVRLWRGKYATPVALVSQVPGQCHPRQIATRVANYINESLLQYPSCGFLYYEDGATLGEQLLSQRIFEYFGHSHRLRLFKPETQPKAWDFMEFVVGEAIER